MGGSCCATACDKHVEFEQVNMKISKKNCDTLERYGQGAAARRETQKLILNCVREITSKLSIIHIFEYFLLTMNFYFRLKSTKLS